LNCLFAHLLHKPLQSKVLERGDIRSVIEATQQPAFLVHYACILPTLVLDWKKVSNSSLTAHSAYLLLPHVLDTKVQAPENPHSPYK
jgi:hypothetical protein